MFIINKMINNNITRTRLLYFIVLFATERIMLNYAIHRQMVLYGSGELMASNASGAVVTSLAQQVTPIAGQRPRLAVDLRLSSLASSLAIAISLAHSRFSTLLYVRTLYMQSLFECFRSILFSSINVFSMVIYMVLKSIM